MMQKDKDMECQIVIIYASTLLFFSLSFLAKSGEELSDIQKQSI